MKRQAASIFRFVGLGVLVLLMAPLSPAYSIPCAELLTPESPRFRVQGGKAYIRISQIKEFGALESVYFSKSGGLVLNYRYGWQARDWPSLASDSSGPWNLSRMTRWFSFAKPLSRLLRAGFKFHPDTQTFRLSRDGREVVVHWNDKSSSIRELWIESHTNPDSKFRGISPSGNLRFEVQRGDRRFEYEVELNLKPGEVIARSLSPVGFDLKKWEPDPSLLPEWWTTPVLNRSELPLGEIEAVLKKERKINQNDDLSKILLRDETRLDSQLRRTKEQLMDPIVKLFLAHEMGELEGAQRVRYGNLWIEFDISGNGNSFFVWENREIPFRVSRLKVYPMNVNVQGSHQEAILPWIELENVLAAYRYGYWGNGRRHLNPVTLNEMFQ